MDRPPIGSDEGSHWLLPDERVRRRLDAQGIVKQAHTLVHEGGAAALTMRRLAAALGTSTSALYRRVPSKQWLLIAVVDYVFADVDTSTAYVRDQSGRVRLERLSQSLRDVLSADPHLHEVLTSHVAATPNTVRIAEAALTCLQDSGLRDDELVDAYNAWYGYVIGFTAIEITPPNVSLDTELQQAIRAEMDRISAHDFPIIRELMSRIRNTAYGLRWESGRLGLTGKSFEWGLDALLDGFQARRNTP